MKINLREWLNPHYIAIIIDTGVLCSVWSLLALEIHLLPTIAINFNKDTVDGINHIFLGLSYSYLAGWIIYLLTVSLPESRKRQRMRPVIKQEIEYIANQLHNLVMEFCLPPNENPDTSNVKQCIKTMKDRNWDDPASMLFKSKSLILKQSFICDFTNLTV